MRVRVPARGRRRPAAVAHGRPVFNTGAETVNGRALSQTGWASICVDDERPPSSFVTISDPVTISTEVDPELPWTTRIAARYMGPALAEQYGRPNAVAGELLVRLRAGHVVAVSNLAD